METLKERAEMILSEMDGVDYGKKVRLAKIAGCTKGAVGQWFSRKDARMSYSCAKNIHEKLGYEIAWLLTGSGEKLSRNSHSALLDVSREDSSGSVRQVGVKAAMIVDCDPESSYVDISLHSKPDLTHLTYVTDDELKMLTAFRLASPENQNYLFRAVELIRIATRNEI